jgi:alpha-tubulin suppressor-like RCC1 family protein
MSANSSNYYTGTKTDGTLWTWGGASTGALGQNTIVSISSPTQIGTDTTWSENHTATEQWTSGGVKTDGTLWMWGNNSFGRLGQNQAPSTRNGYSSPVQIPGTTWSTTAGGLSAGNSTFAIKSDGTAWAWGRGGYGSIGLNQPTNSDRSSPVQMPGTTWKQFAANGYNTGAVKTDGTMWTWGFGTQGRLGHNVETATCSSPTQVGTDTTWKQIANAYRSFLAVKTDGTLWSWGYNNYGSLGLNGPVTNPGKRSAPTQIGTDSTWAFCGCNIEYGNMASKTDGTLWVWGRNTYGQMGQNAAAPVDLSSPTQIPGTAWGTTFNKFGIGARHFSIIQGT